jgi:rubrerythrin
MFCPKCHAPLADESDGPYICCADAPMQWQCGQCGKVSEGFAFPYGQCPECGGKLALREDDRTVRTDKAALEAVRLAFEIELGGRAFYQRAAAESSDDELRALFGRLAVMEGEHMETLSRRYHVEPPDPSPAFRVQLAAIFAEVDHRPQAPDNLFRIAIALEKRAASFFATRSAQAPAGSAEQRLYLELGAEERAHASMLATEYERWRARKPGLFRNQLINK